ncbi:hypothetical protein SODG_006694 [Sodalis praecaptivus]|uniref:hypothetical protein n=1 Tax=Sodalis TaxID=84565 RepID=UPI00046D1A26|nr:hypothetical protein [Sodalis praecaptivus]CAJ0994101.1 hypothetical protein NVIRENTERO_01253 [Sodalis praecaptivus]
MESFAPIAPVGGEPSRLQRRLMAFSAVFDPPGLAVNDEVLHALEQRAGQRQYLAWNWSFRF